MQFSPLLSVVVGLWFSSLLASAFPIPFHSLFSRATQPMVILPKSLKPLDPRVQDFASIAIAPLQDDFQSEDFSPADVPEELVVRRSSLGEDGSTTLVDDVDDLDFGPPTSIDSLQFAVRNPESEYIVSGLVRNAAKKSPLRWLMSEDTKSETEESLSRKLLPFINRNRDAAAPPAI